MAGSFGVASVWPAIPPADEGEKVAKKTWKWLKVSELFQIRLLKQQEAEAEWIKML